MEEETLRNRIRIFFAKREHKIASSQINLTSPSVEFDSSMAPLIKKPISIPAPAVPSDSWGSDETVEEQKQEFSFSEALKNHRLSKEPESIKHLTSYLFFSQVPSDEALQFITAKMIPEQFAKCPSAEALTKKALNSKTSRLIEDAKLAMDSSDWLKAFQLLNKAIEVDPKCHIAFYGLALAYFREHLLDKAIENLTHALELDSHCSDLSLPIKQNLYAALVARGQE